MDTTKTADEDLEIRTLKDLHEIKLEIQEIKALINNSNLQFKMAISEHQAQCPMMHKDFLLKSDCFPAWKECYAQHAKETGKTFDLWYERGKKIIIATGALWIMASTINWTAVLQIVK